MLPQGADGEVDDGAHCPVPDGPAGATAKAWSEWLSSTEIDWDSDDIAPEVLESGSVFSPSPLTAILKD